MSQELKHQVTDRELQRLHWRNELSGELPETALLTDCLRSARAKPALERFRARLNEAVARKVERLSKGSDLAAYLIFLTALQALLARYSGKDDVLVGSPRHYGDGDAGAMAERGARPVVPIRTHIEEGVTFKELLLAVRKTAFGAYANQGYPFESMLADLELEPSEERFPLFDLLALHEGIHRREDVEGLGLDLVLVLRREDGLPAAELLYDPALLATSTVASFWRHLQEMLSWSLANLDAPIEEAVVVSSGEEHRLLVELNDNARPYPVDRTLHELFEEQVERWGDRVAAVGPEGERTYRQLNEDANRLARLLRDVGVNRGEFVGVLHRRGLGFLTSILAIFKAGGAYVPIEPTLPGERVRYLLDNSQVHTVITETKALEGLRGTLEEAEELATAIVLDREAAEAVETGGLREIPGSAAAGLAAENLDGVNGPRDPLYMIFTSGSTGAPKGAVVRHDGAVNHNFGRIETLAFGEDSSFLQTASSATDISVWQMLAPVLSGGRTVIVEDEVVFDPNLLLKVLDDAQPTLLELVPVLLRSVLEEVEQRPERPRGLAQLEWMIATGEALPAELVNRWLKLFPEVRMVNCYGPTEASDDITQLIIDTPIPEDQRSVSIGSPLPNLDLYIVDSKMRLSPFGVPGEICVAGVGVGAGYWRNPKKTEESFVPNPFPGGKGDVIYRTGDLGRWLPDGNIEFLGRIDHQVKIRGFRIELGEIEAVLSGHPRIREIVVTAREDTPGHRRLVAYAVPQGDPPSVDELVEYLNERLPDYMIPSAAVFLDELPLTGNGKVDRKALPEPDAARPELGAVFVAPRDDKERALAEVWADLLGLDQVGVHDNFFRLGGDSILSIQAVTRAGREGLKLTPQQLFQHPTIAELAELAEDGRIEEAEQGVVSGRLPLTAIQGWFFEELRADWHHWNQSILLELRQEMAPELVETVVARLLEHHDALRTRFQPDAGGWSQEILPRHPGGAFEVCDLSEVPPSEQKAALEERAASYQEGLDPLEGDLLRIVLFDLGGHDPGRLLIVCHHLVIDGVSWRILLEDFETAFRQLNRGEELSLPPKTTSLKAWAEGLRAYADSEELRRELPFWEGQVAGSFHELPVDQESGLGNTVGSAKTLTVQLDKEETAAVIKDLPDQLRASINDVLLAALMGALQPWIQRGKLRLDLEGHGREGSLDGMDLSRTVAWFTSAYPVLLDVEGASGPVGCVKAVKQCLGRVPQRGFGYGPLRYCSRVKEVVEGLRVGAGGRVTFNYLGQFDQVLSPISPFRAAWESAGDEYGVRGARSHLLDVTANVNLGKLRFDWTYSENVHLAETVQRLAEACLEELRSLIEAVRSTDVSGYAPTDFPMANLDQAELSQLSALLEVADKTSRS